MLLRMRQPDPRSTVLTPGIVDVTGIEVPDEEYFGPLLTIIRYDGFPEAIRLANQTRYGTAVGLISVMRRSLISWRTRREPGSSTGTSR